MKTTITAITATIAAAALLLTGCDSEPRPYDFETAAHNACTNAVKGKLKSASSAKFDGIKSTESNTGAWSVLGSVDSENSFGAMATTDFACDVKVMEPNEDGDRMTETKILFMQQR